MTINANYFWQRFIERLLTAGTRTKVADDFHGRVLQIDSILDNDKTGIVSTVYEFMVEAGTVDFKFESGNENLDERLALWTQNINLGVNDDIPRGLRALTAQYLRERWRSSFIALNITWKNIDGYILPSRMWFTDGGNIYVGGSGNRLNGYDYFIGKAKKKPLKSTEQKTVIIRKPYNSWYTKYPSPYLTHKGALYNALVKTELVEKQADLVNSIVPHILQISAGNDTFAKQDGGMPTEPELEELKQKIVDMTQDYKYKNEKGTNYGAFPYDVKLENLIPDLTKFLNETIVKPFDKNLFSALGLVELEGFAKSRQETILNPKVLVAEVTDGVDDWKKLLQDVLALIVVKNAQKHPKDTKKKVRVVSGSITTFLTDNMRVFLRSIFDRGTIGHQDILERATDLDFDISLERRLNEREEIDDVLFPHQIQNLDNQPTDQNIKDTPEETIDENSPQKKKSEKDVETSEIEDFTKLPRYQSVKAKRENVEAPYKNIDELPDSIKNVLPVGAQIIWLQVFNKALKQGDSEETAIKKAWGAVKKKYKKVQDKKKWVKK